MLLESDYTEESHVAHNYRKILDIHKTIETEDEFYSSEEWDKLWEGFQGRELKERVGRRFEFIKGFVVKKDPKKNYGRDFDLYKLYKTSCGMTSLIKQEKSACVSSAPMNEVHVFNDKLCFTNIYFKKNSEARRFIRRHDIVVSV